MAAKHQHGKLEVRSDGRRAYYRVRVWVATPEGIRRKAFFIGYKDETPLKAARQRRLEILAKANGGTLQDTTGTTFKALVDRFNALRLPQLKASVRSLYAQHLKRHIIPVFGDADVTKITRLWIEEWLDAKAKDKLSWWTRHGMLATLSAVCSAAVEWRLMESNPCRGVSCGRKEEKREKRVFAPVELQAVLAALDARTRLLCAMLAITAVRVGEAIALRWSDIDWTTSTVLIQRRWYRGNMDVPKTPLSRRRRWIGPLLETLRERQPEHDGFIFTDDGNTPLNEQHLLRQRLRPALRQAGVYTTGMGWHSFRRWHVTALQEVGASTAEAMRLVGHASELMTARYTIVVPARERELVGELSSRLIA